MRPIMTLTYRITVIAFTFSIIVTLSACATPAIDPFDTYIAKTGTNLNSDVVIHNNKPAPGNPFGITRTETKAPTANPFGITQSAKNVFDISLTPETWIISKEKTLKENINQLSKQAGWNPVSWEATNDYRVSTTVTVQGGFFDAIKKLLTIRDLTSAQ